MSESEMNNPNDNQGANEEPRPFFRTPIGIILIIIVALIVCCCTALLIIGLSAESLIEWMGGLVDDPEFQRQLEEIQMTIEAAE